MANQSLLQQLRDIHVPEPVGIWPVAPGWWLLLAGFLFVLLMALYLRPRFKAYQLKKIYLMQLEDIRLAYGASENNRMLLERLAALLKRVALLSYPREQVASLHGDAWVNFLAQSLPDADMNPMRDLFTKALYQKNYQQDMRGVFKLVAAWIKKQRLSCIN